MGLLVAGGLYLGWMLILRREVLDTEPGATPEAMPARPESTE